MPNARKLHEARYLPRIALYERKMAGVLDPMEETIGLYKVIFLIAPDADEVEKREYGYRWIAGLCFRSWSSSARSSRSISCRSSRRFSPARVLTMCWSRKEFIALENLRAFYDEYTAPFEPLTPAIGDDYPVADPDDASILARRVPIEFRESGNPETERSREIVGVHTQVILSGAAAQAARSRRTEVAVAEKRGRCLRASTRSQRAVDSRSSDSTSRP